MNKDFFALGQAIDGAIRKIRAAINRRLRRPPQPGVIIDIVANAYMLGSNVAWVVHGAYLGFPYYMPKLTLDQFKQRALDQGQFAATRYAAQVDDAGGMILAQIARWASIASDASLWRGQDEAAQILSKQAEVEFKTWVRAYPREEERPHSVLEGATIPVDDLFTLPSGKQVWGPRDWSTLPDPGEWVNCGHALTYSREATQSDIDQTRKILFKSGLA